jgi:hypothetical protein
LPGEIVVTEGVASDGIGVCVYSTGEVECGDLVKGRVGVESSERDGDGFVGEV